MEKNIVSQSLEVSKKAIDIINSPEFKAITERISKEFGFIECCQPVVMNGDKGFLVWDYILFNEITFVNSENGNHTSMYTSTSDKKTKAEFDKIIAKFCDLK